MDKIKTDRATLRKFGLTMAACFAVITTIIFLRHKHSTVITSLISLSFLLFAATIPALLKYFYITLMKFAFILGWFNTRLLLCVIFYLVFSPIGLLMRLFKIDLLDRRFNRTSQSYWKPKEKKVFSAIDYERQF